MHLTLSAPAKVNLYLEVLGRRPDGFHALETIFQTLDLADEVSVTVSAGSGVALQCIAPGVPADATNLAWRAAAAYLAERPLGHVDLTLIKRIPHGAGLGGGSSDAAAVLRALAQLDAQPLPAARLHAIAAELGSDVPFFLLGGTALAHGRGEVLTPLPPAPATSVTVLMPAAHLPTPAVFTALTDAERGPRPAQGRILAERLATGHIPLFNRLTGPARRLCPAAAALLDHLATTGLPHLLSGSGASCFVLGEIEPPPGVRAYRTRFA